MHANQLATFTADPHFRELFALLQRPRGFNLLSALSIGRQELRHSDLLAFLLNPRESHGLDVQFARRLIHHAASLVAPILDVASLKLQRLEIRREWEFIDILLVSPEDKVVVIVENKIDSTEHSNQLSRYYALVQHRYSDYAVIGLYLTLEAAPPAVQQDHKRYAPIGYSDVAIILNDIVEQTQPKPEVALLLRHYVEHIRRTLVPELDADQALLGRQLYIQHRTTIETIYQARDARMWMIQRYFASLLATSLRDESTALALNKPFFNSHLPRWHTRFAPIEWNCPLFTISKPWARNNMLVAFEFMHSPSQIHFSLTVGPSRTPTDLRQRLYDLAGSGIEPLSQAWNEPADDFFSIYHRTVLPQDSNYFTEFSDEEIRTKVQYHWDQFLNNHLPLIRAAINDSILRPSSL